MTDEEAIRSMRAHRAARELVAWAVPTIIAVAVSLLAVYLRWPA
jgi:hypothetical protein